VLERDRDVVERFDVQRSTVVQVQVHKCAVFGSKACHVT
jgi:hypothetical protein